MQQQSRVYGTSEPPEANVQGYEQGFRLEAYMLLALGKQGVRGIRSWSIENLDEDGEFLSCMHALLASSDPRCARQNAADESDAQLYSGFVEMAGSSTACHFVHWQQWPNLA